MRPRTPPSRRLLPRVPPSRGLLPCTPSRWPHRAALPLLYLPEPAPCALCDRHAPCALSVGVGRRRCSAFLKAPFCCFFKKHSLKKLAFSFFEKPLPFTSLCFFEKKNARISRGVCQQWRNPKKAENGVYINIMKKTFRAFFAFGVPDLKVISTKKQGEK